MKYEHRICYDIEIMIKRPSYNLDDLASKISIFLAYGQITQDEYSTLMSLIDAEKIVRAEQEKQK